MKSLIEKLRGKIPDALIAQLENLPPSLTLKRIPYYRAKPNIVVEKRGAFNGKLRTEFLKHIGLNHAESLRAMGLNDEMIDDMRYDGVLNTHTRETADCTVDHILSLTFGGNNTFDNLMLLPQCINHLKNELEKAQFTTAAQSEVITIVPANPADKVPFVANGYIRPKALAQ